MENKSSNIFKSTIAFSVKPIVFIIFYLVYNNAQRCYHKSTDRISASVCLPADSWHIYHHQQIFACFLSFQLLLLCIMLICAWDIYTLITGILDVTPENVHDSCLMLPPLFIFLRWRHLTHIKTVPSCFRQTVRGQAGSTWKMVMTRVGGFNLSLFSWGWGFRYMLRLFCQTSSEHAG